MNLDFITDVTQQYFIEFLDLSRTREAGGQHIAWGAARPPGRAKPRVSVSDFSKPMKWATDFPLPPACCSVRAFAHFVGLVILVERDLGFRSA